MYLLPCPKRARLDTGQLRCFNGDGTDGFDGLYSLGGLVLWCYHRLLLQLVIHHINFSSVLLYSGLPRSKELRVRAARFYTFFDFSFWVVIKSGEMVRKYDMQKHFALSLYLQVAHLGQISKK